MTITFEKYPLAEKLKELEDAGSYHYSIVRGPSETDLLIASRQTKIPLELSLTLVDSKHEAGWTTDKVSLPHYKASIFIDTFQRPILKPWTGRFMGKRINPSAGALAVVSRPCISGRAFFDGCRDEFYFLAQYDVSERSDGFQPIYFPYHQDGPIKGIIPFKK